MAQAIAQSCALRKKNPSCLRIYVSFHFRNVQPYLKKNSILIYPVLHQARLIKEIIKLVLDQILLKRSILQWVFLNCKPFS